MKPQSILISLSKLSSTLILVSIFINIFTLVYAASKLDHYQSLLCVDLQCQEPISDGITTNIYPSPEKILLSFKKNSNVKIFGKTGDKHFYFVEVNKKRGFVPAKLIKETNIHFEETKLNDVKFDFKGFERNLTSKFQSKSELNQTKNNDTINVPLSSSDQQIPDDQLSSTATPFVYSQKITVIDGTTIAEDLLVTTATPSPTFVESPVTKTATIEANFTENFVELDKETVTQKENELSKERGSLYKQLVKPIVVPPPSQPVNVVDNNQNDVIVESEDSSEQENFVDNQIDVNVADDDGANNNEIVEEKNTNSVDDVSNEDANVLEQKQQNVASTNVNVDVNDSSQVDEEQPIEKIEIQTNITSEIPQPVQEESVQQVNNNNNNGVFDENVQQNNSTVTENVNVDSSDHVDDADVDIPGADLSINDEEQNVLISHNNNSIDVIDSNAVETGEKSNIEENINDNNLNPKEINADTATKQNLDSSSSHQIDKRSIIEADENVVLSQQHQTLVADAASVAEPILDNPSKLSEDKIDDLSKSAYQQQQQPPQLPPLKQAETIPSPSSPSHVNVVNNADLTSSSTAPQQPSLINVQQPHHHQHQQQPQNTLLNAQTLSENNPNHQHHQQHQQYFHNEIPTQAPPQNFENINVNVVPPHLSQQQKQQQYIENPNVNNVPSPQVTHQSHPSPQQPIVQPIRPEFVPNSKEDPIPSESILINTHHHHQPQQQKQTQQLHQQQQQQQQQEHISDSSFIPPLRNDNYHNQANIVAANNNIAKRRFLAERVGFVSVIMEIIPDEVELFFESFNISLHAIICTSIIAFFWCMMKILIFFISSSKKVRELRDVICQVQRKLYYFETEKEKIEQKYNNCRGESSNYQDNLNKIEKRRYQLEQDNEKLKNEINILKNENITLKSQAQNNPQINAKLNSVSTELEKWKQENSQLNLKVKKLEEQIESHLLTIKNQEKAAELDKEEIDNLNEQLEQLNEEIQKLNEIIKESEQKFNLVQLENTNLKELQNKLNEEIKEMKDDLLSSQEKAEKFEKQSISLEQQLKMANEKIKTQMEELEKKNVEIQSMQTLLSKLNKNLNKKEQNIRQQRSADINGDIMDNLNGDSDSITIDPDLSNDDDGRENNDGICLQDVVQLQLRLTQLEHEKEQYKNRYEAIQKQIDDMISDVESTKQLNQQLKQEIETAREERLKAITELEVLSKYYKAKELEYAKDIGVHKIKQEQQNEDVESMSSKLEIVQEENSMLKEQLKSLKKELDDTERRLKSQLNQLEKQSHENWIAARAAERKYEECKAEASALRQTLSQSVKSPPPGELSSFIGLGGSFLDDTASSVSSLPEGVLNTSLQVPPPPPPPPPPFPFPSIFAPVIPPPSHQPPMVPPGGSGGGSALFDPHHHQNTETNPANNSTTYWSAPPPFSAPSSVAPIPNLPPPPVPPSSISSTTYPYDLSKNSITQPVSSTTDSTSMTFSQANPTRQQPYGQQQAYSTSTPNTNNNPYNYGHHHPQHHESFHNSQLDLSRNTYSPAMSQRSTHTPLTNPSLSYDMQQRQQQQQQQPNPYGSITMHQQTTALQQDPRFINTNANNNNNNSNDTNNPYSVNNNYQQQQPSSSHDVYSSPHHHHVQQQVYPNTSMVGNQQQYQSQPQHSVIDTNSTNNSLNYPNYPNVQPHLMQQQSQPTLQQSSQSRPQSVHNQMV